MTHDEIIKQLESLLSHCKSMVEKDGGFPIWEKDCEALEAAIAALRPSGEPLTLEQLRKMDGRCVVLPCKVGEKVYDITTGNIVEKTVVSIPFLLSKSANHLSLHAINKRDATTTIEPADIGKTVFLTPEAAEAALKGEQDG